MKKMNKILKMWDNKMRVNKMKTRNIHLQKRQVTNRKELKTELKINQVQNQKKCKKLKMTKLTK